MSVGAIDKRGARQAFERAAAAYDEAAVLQREIADRMLERLDYVRLEPRTILDLGAGTGYAIVPLQRRYRKARVLAADFALNMVSGVPPPRLLAQSPTMPVRRCRSPTAGRWQCRPHLLQRHPAVVHGPGAHLS